VVVGRDYWQCLFDWLEKEAYQKMNAINKEDLNIFELVDSADEAIKIIKSNK
jgi:predicted Rossmann-fold nucleotide-binding protein